MDIPALSPCSPSATFLQRKQFDGIVAGSVNGNVFVITSGNIAANGSNASGISASISSGDLSVTIASGSVSGGSGTGAGVMFIGGGTNALNNFGTISALSGLAILGGGNDETVNNHGMVIGNVDLGAGSNAFNNFAGALFQSGTTASVGAFANAGTLSPGGSGALQTTAFDDTLVQIATGVLAIDLNAAAGTSDKVIVSNTASLAGTVAVNLTSLPAAAQQTFTILQGLGGVTDNGLMLLASPALGASLSFHLYQRPPFNQRRLRGRERAQQQSAGDRQQLEAGIRGRRGGSEPGAVRPAQHARPRRLRGRPR